MHPLIITRPGADGQKWVDSFRDAGLCAASLPLIEISATLDNQSLRAQTKLCVAPALTLSDFDTWLYVSPSAVRHFLSLDTARSTMMQTSQLRHWATGPGTVNALKECGVDISKIDYPDSKSIQFDSETLWQRIFPYLDTVSNVLILRGKPQEEASSMSLSAGMGREWFSHQLRQAGKNVAQLAVYQRGLPTWARSPAEKLKAEALLQDKKNVWLFTSSESLLNLKQIFPALDMSGLTAITTHPNIDAVFRELMGCEKSIQIKPLISQLIEYMRNYLK